MYEEKTFDSILSDMLSYVNDKYPDLDIREGSVVYTALAPIAFELETIYHELDMVLDETFLATASKEYLVKHGDQLGLEINDATNGYYEGEFDVEVEIGSRFNLGDFNYTVIEKISDPTDENPYYTFELVCETSGSAPNDYLGDLTPITYSGNLSHAKLTSVLVYGEDEEDTEAYRYRLQMHIKEPPIDGNVAQYNEWLGDYDGIGKYRTKSCWNGVNTVKLLILNSENKAASDDLIEKVQNYFDPPTATINDDPTDASYPQGRGMGNGQAPIGAIVTVDTVTEVPVKVECQLTLKDGYSTPVGVEEAVDAYIQSLVLEKTTVSYIPIAAQIYNAESVQNIDSLKITVNGTVMDTEVSPFVDSVSIGDNEIPVLDVVNSVWGV